MDSNSVTPRERGVTLIELMVVLAILGTAIALVSPSIMASVDRFRLNATGHQLVDALRLAKTEARFTQQDMLCLEVEGQFVVLRGSTRVHALNLPAGLRLIPSSSTVTYTVLPSGQILGPERLELLGTGTHKGVVILGPPPGTVRFEMKS